MPNPRAIHERTSRHSPPVNGLEAHLLSKIKSRDTLFRVSCSVLEPGQFYPFARKIITQSDIL